MLKKIKDINEWKHIPCSWIAKLNIIKMPMLSKAIYKFKSIPAKISMFYFTKIEKAILKFKWTIDEPRIANRILKKNKAGGLILPDFNIYYKATVIRTVWY